MRKSNDADIVPPPNDIERNPMLGAQEILIISAIVVGALVIPRAMNQNKPAPGPKKPAKKLSVKWRMGIAVSIAYPLVAAAVMQPWRKDPFIFCYIGLGPVLFGWLIWWVVNGPRRG